MHDMVETLELLNLQLHQAHRKAVDAELSRRGLREVGHPMLMTILQSYERNSECCQAQCELAQQLHISPAAVATSLKSLEKSGYIRREPEERDARRNRVLLTEQGRRAVEGCQEAFRAVADRMLDGFSPEEQELLRQFRERMLNNLWESDSTAKEEL